jgi:cytochrome d ubiquinol oxidase subunit II
VYLTGEAGRRGQTQLRAYFARRAQGAAVVAGALSLAALAELHTSNPVLYGRLTGRALPLVIVAGVCGLVVLARFVAGRTTGTRAIAALGVAAVIWGWGVAQYPVLLPGTTVTLSNAGAPHATLVALIVVFIAAVLLVGPSFGLLFTLQSRRLLDAGNEAVASAVAPVTGPVTAPVTGPPPGLAAQGAALVMIAVAVIRRLRRS